MKKVLFVSAVMCMAMAAFVACNKNNDGNDPEGGNNSGMCVCTTTYMGYSAPVDTELYGYATCAAMGEAMQAVAPSGTTISCKNK